LCPRSPSGTERIEELLRGCGTGPDRIEVKGGWAEALSERMMPNHPFFRISLRVAAG